MKFTRYFHAMRNRPDRCQIRMEWIERAVNDPDQEAIQADGRIRRWLWVPEVRKHLRVVLLDDRETVHNAFFDRGHEEVSDED